MNKRTSKRRGREQWRQIIARQEVGGKSVPEYCREKKLSEKNFTRGANNSEKPSAPGLKVLSSCPLRGRCTPKHYASRHREDTALRWRKESRRTMSKPSYQPWHRHDLGNDNSAKDLCVSGRPRYAQKL
ncbi:MAG: hypothetical protein K8S27_00590 [Candidatus Omnitrophica bacterium]|nr:hypothetical protein [Candidatus Omnitrophota bacterium]